MNSQVMTIEAGGSLVRVMHLVYALHALGLAIGAFGAATVLGSFLFGWPSIIAVIIGYVKRDDARGTWLESHFAWAIATFWIALAFAAVVLLVGLPLVLLFGLGFVVWFIGFGLLGLWAIYRIGRGWLRLNSRRAMPA